MIQQAESKTMKASYMISAWVYVDSGALERTVWSVTSTWGATHWLLDVVHSHVGSYPIRDVR
jgi:hypothetical protein